MKKSSSIIILIFPVIFLLLCSSYKTSPESWEGISDNKLIIIISEFFPFEENLNQKEMKNQITERLNQRASLILASYISINLSRNKISQNNDITFNNLINDTISNSRLMTFDCSENNYCTANSEYDITGLKEKLESINNQ